MRYFQFIVFTFLLSCTNSNYSSLERNDFRFMMGLDFDKPRIGWENKIRLSDSLYIGEGFNLGELSVRVDSFQISIINSNSEYSVSGIVKDDMTSEIMYYYNVFAGKSLNGKAGKVIVMASTQTDSLGKFKLIFKKRDNISLYFAFLGNRTQEYEIK